MNISKLRTYYRAINSFCTNAKSDIHENIVNALFPPLKPAYQKAPAHSPKSQLHRMAERGNVFFTLFAAVAVVGTLGAGIMSTMRGPLSTMVEVNRREQASAEVRLATGLVLVNSGDFCADDDGFTEGANPLTPGGPSGGGLLPAVGAPQSDPWGTPYGYCAWDHGNTLANATGCGDLLAGGVNTNSIAIAVISAGPDRAFQTSCAPENGGSNDYIEPDGGGGDDIVVSQTYDQAVSGSGGLWEVTDTDPNAADIDRNIDLTNTSTRLGGASPQLRLGAASLILPDQNLLTTCNSANDTLLRVNTSGTIPAIELCDGSATEWLSAGTDSEGQIDAVRFCDEDGANCTLAADLGPDNLGNHTATTTLNMNRNTIANSGPIVFDEDWNSLYDLWIQGAGGTGGARNLAFLGLDENSGDYLSINWNGEYAGGTRVHSRLAVGGNFAPSQALHVSGNVLATAYFHSSDRNLKNNIKTVDDPWTILNAIHGVTYNWKNNGEASAGIIAQDVEAVMPSAVKTDDKGLKSVEYNQLIAPIIEAIKELAAKTTELLGNLATLQKENAELKAQNKDILKRLEALETK